MGLARLRARNYLETGEGRWEVASDAAALAAAAKARAGELKLLPKAERERAQVRALERVGLQRQRDRGVGGGFFSVGQCPPYPPARSPSPCPSAR